MAGLLELALVGALGLASFQDGARQVVVPDSAPEVVSRPQESPVVAVASGLTLAQLLDSCSALLDVRIEFTPTELTQPFHPLQGASYSARDLLQAANRELEALGKTTISPPQSDLLRVVTLADAKAQAGLHSLNGTLDLTGDALPGYVRVMVPLDHADPKEVLASVQKLVSKQGEVSVVGNTSSLLVSDLSSRVSMILNVLKGLDVAEGSPSIEEFRPTHLGVKLLAIRLEQLSAKHKAVSNGQLAGSILVLEETNELLFIAPISEMAWWQNGAARLDRPEPVSTIHYTPRRFGLAETRALIQEHLLASPIQAPDPRIVTDDLTGALIITATPSTHDEINDLLNRLEQTDSSPEPRLQAFQIGNRPAVEVQALLSELLAEGVIDSEESIPGGSLDNGIGGPVEGHEPKTSARPFKSGTSLGQGEASLTVDPTNNMILAFGPPKSLKRIEDLITVLDLRQPQIMVEATIVSLSESEAQSLGIELAGISDGGDDLFQLASLFGLGAPSPADLALPALGGNGMSGTVLSPGSFSAAIRALQSATNGRSLSRPKLLVSAGRTADLGSVLQTPYTSTNASSTVSTTSLGGTLDAGTEITVTPKVAEGERIMLEYTVSLSTFVGEASNPNIPPPRQENHIQSVVTIPNGYTVVVGGLEIATEGEDQTSVPILGDIPFLGALFRSDSESSSTNRFYVFLRCSIQNDEHFESLRYISDQAREEVGLPSDYPKIKPMVMR